MKVVEMRREMERKSKERMKGMEEERKRLEKEETGGERKRKLEREIQRDKRQRQFEVERITRLEKRVSALFEQSLGE